MAKKKVIIKEKQEEKEITLDEELEKLEEPLEASEEEERARIFDGEGEYLPEEELTEIEKDLRDAESAEFEEEIELERLYTINLYKAFSKAPSRKRAKKAIRYIKEFLIQHMKAESEEWVYLDQALNERIWENGIRNPPRKLRVRTTRSIDGIVRVFLA